jgi:hypothetical protein
MTNEVHLDKLRKKLEQTGEVSPIARQLVLALAAKPDSTRIGPHCLDELPPYVDAEVAGVDVGTAAYPEIRRHLVLCDACAATYIELMQLAMGELSEEIDMPSLVPAPDLSFISRPTLPNLVRQIAERVLQQLAPQQLPDLSLVADSFFEHFGTLTQPLNWQSSAVRAVGGSDEPVEALPTLTFVYFATKALMARWPRQGATRTTAELEVFAMEEARQTANQLNFPRRLADQLVSAYVEMVRQFYFALNESTPQ